MSQYNIYAKKLDDAFKAARDEYTAAFQKVQQAQQDRRDAVAWRPQDSAAEKQARTARAALVLHDAEAAFNEVSTRVWNNFKSTRQTLRAELEKEIGAAGIANPDAIDSNALELMKTGVLTAADYSAFLDKYDSNPTMLKLLSHYAHEAAKAATDRREAATLNGVAVACQSGQSAVMRAFDELSKSSDYCRGEKYEGKTERPEFVVTMAARWEEITGEIVENF